MPLTVVSTNEQKVPITVSPVTASGNAAQLDGPLTLTTQLGDATVEYDSSVSQLTFNVVSGALPGQSTILVEGDADLGAGVVTLQDLITYDVQSATAVSFGLTAGAPIPK